MKLTSMQPDRTAVPAETPATSPAVLCGTDFSPMARCAADAAVALARRFQGEVELTHASVFPTISANVEELRAEADRLRQSGVPVREVSLAGYADEELVKRAESGNCRLVVVASLGKRAPERWILGSVSERTAERAHVPTVVVRDAAPFEAWARGERPLKVFVAFNFTRTSEAALKWVGELAAIGGCNVVIGHVDWPPEERRRLGDFGPLSLVGNPPVVQTILERDLHARAVDLLGDIPFRLRVEANWGRPDARLVEMAREEGADLLVVGSHQYRGFERLWHMSVSRGVLHSAGMNVAVVPLATGEKRGPEIAPPVRRVLVTTDFSDLANHAIPHAYSLVRGGGTVQLAHVIHPQTQPSGEYPQGPHYQEFKARHSKHVQSCVEKLRALIPAAAALHGVRTEIEIVEHRDAAEGICQAAERFGADVICLGTHGRSGIEKVLMGSVTQKVMTHSRRPLLTVRPPLE